MKLLYELRKKLGRPKGSIARLTWERARLVHILRSIAIQDEVIQARLVTRARAIPREMLRCVSADEYCRLVESKVEALHAPRGDPVGRASQASQARSPRLHYPLCMSDLRWPPRTQGPPQRCLEAWSLVPPSVSNCFPRLRASVKSIAKWRPLLVLLPILPVYASIPVVLGPGGGQLGDEPVYLYYARALVHGHYAEAPSWSWISHGPGLPAVLTPLVAAHAPILAARIFVGPVVLFCAVVVFFRVADMLLDRMRALVCAYLFAAYWPFLPLLRSIHNEPLTVLLVVALAHRIAVWSRSRRRRDVVITGVILASLALVRVEFGYLLVLWIVIVAASLALRRRADVARYALASSVLALILCIPYLAYTQSVTHRFFYWSGSGGAQLYWMDTGRSQDEGDWHGRQEVFTNPNLAAHRALFREIEARPPEDWDTELQSAAFRNIRQHPLLYVRNLVLNDSRLVLNVPYSYKPIKWPSILFYGVANLTLIVAAALSLLAIRRRRQPMPPMPLLLAWFSVTTFAIHTVVAALTQHLVPIVPALAALALYGVRFADSRRDRLCNDVGVSAT